MHRLRRSWPHWAVALFVCVTALAVVSRSDAATTDTTFGYVTEAGASALTQGQGEVDSTVYTLSGAPAGSILSGMRAYLDGSSGAQDPILAAWDDATGDLIGYCTPVVSSGVGWKACTAVTLVSDGVMPNGDYHLGSMAASGGGNGRNFYKGGSAPLRYYYPCGCSTPPDPWADSGSAGGAGMLIEATVTLTEEDPPPDDDPPPPDTADCTDALDPPTCNNVALLTASIGPGAQDKLSMLWVGVWFLGGLSFGLWFGRTLWNEFRQWAHV